MHKVQIQTDKAPAAIGPYSQAITCGNLLFTSGTLPIDPQTGLIEEGDIEMHAEQTFRNLVALAEAAGTDLAKTVKVTIFLTDIGDFSRVNEMYKQFFPAPYPSRSVVQVAALPLGAAIEAEAIIAL